MAEAIGILRAKLATKIAEDTEQKRQLAEALKKLKDKEQGS